MHAVHMPLGGDRPQWLVALWLAMHYYVEHLVDRGVDALQQLLRRLLLLLALNLRLRLRLRLVGLQEGSRRRTERSVGYTYVHAERRHAHAEKHVCMRTSIHPYVSMHMRG